MIEIALTLEELVQKTKIKFEEHYGRPARWIVVAPGRVNIIGEHTDYNGGFVFPMGIERYTVLAADLPKKTVHDTVVVKCLRFNETAHIKLSQITRAEPRWANYIRGVIRGFQEKNIQTPALDVVMDSTVPLGGGLSSSAALEIATGTLIEAVTGKNVTQEEKALIGQKAEHEFAGVPCGIMDQFISVMARKNHIMLLDCSNHETQWTEIKNPDVSFLVINSNVKHQLASGEYGKRRSECETASRIMGVKWLRDADMELLESFEDEMPVIPYRRAKHVITENIRTSKAASALSNSLLEETGTLMYESHQSLMSDFEVSCVELDYIVEISKKIGLSGGVYGCRMTGGGFGGCAISLVETKMIPHISETIEREYKEKTGLKCSIFASRPADGARVIEQ
ncbi:MAG: galactokinase [Verrucomicrobia bacterium]|jgi:galactokinase|nr:galactokinase [Verrucomicrobiota bacterium]